MDGSVRRLADAQPGFGRCGPDRGDAHRGREHHGCAPQRRGEDTDLAHRPGDRCSGRQNAKNSLFDDDGKEVGYVYYYEPFDWTSKFNGTDCVGEHTQNGAVNIYSKVNGQYVVDKAFSDAGLTDFNPGVRTIYACSDYLKMGAGDKQTGIILPALAIPEGQATDIELTFVAASNIGGDGTGKPDAVTVTVAILEGPGSINGDQGKESEPMTPGEHWEWTPMSVKLYGITG